MPRAWPHGLDLLTNWPQVPSSLLRTSASGPLLARRSLRPGHNSWPAVSSWELAWVPKLAASQSLPPRTLLLPFEVPLS